MARWLVTGDSRVRFVGRSTLHPVEGRATRVSGTIEVELDRDGSITSDHAPSARLEVAASDLTSDNRLQDREMRRRIGARQHPVIRWELVRATGGPDRFTVDGRVTLNGRTDDVRAEVDLNVHGDELIAAGQHSFDVRAFGVTPPRLLGLRVDPEVTVIARIVARRRDDGDG